MRGIVKTLNSLDDKRCRDIERLARILSVDYSEAEEMQNKMDRESEISIDMEV